MLSENIKNNLKCACCCIIKLFLFCLLVALPVVGIVWWFVTKQPMQFMFICFGISMLWIGLGIGYYFYRYSDGKYKQLTK